MLFDPPLLHARFLGRYKRFFADFLLGDQRVVAHCPNTGSMQGCLALESAACLQPAQNMKRSLRFTWKLIQVGETWVGIDTGVAVPLVREAIDAGLIGSLQGFERTFTEVKYGREGQSRIDLLLSQGGTAPVQKTKARALPTGDRRVYVEVKNTTLVSDGVAMFPDAVTERGQKHLRELMDVVEAGQRAAMVYCVQRDDCHSFRPADAIDPTYGRLLREAAARGVELYALRVRCSPGALTPDAILPVAL
jgi:sugar fermentation stimulation protein A